MYKKHVSILDFSLHPFSVIPVIWKKMLHYLLYLLKNLISLVVILVKWIEYQYIFNFPLRNKIKSSFLIGKKFSPKQFASPQIRRKYLQNIYLTNELYQDV